MAEKFDSLFANEYHARARYSKTDTFLPLKVFKAASYWLALVIVSHMKA